MGHYMMLPQNADTSGILPASMQEVAKDAIIFAGGTQEGEIDCVAVFLPSKYYRDEVVLHYIYVVEEKRRQRLAHGLLNYAKEEFYSVKVRVVLVKECSGDMGLSVFLGKEGFIPLSFQGRLYEYPLTFFTEHPLLRQMPDNKCSRVKKLEDCSEFLFRHFRARAAGEGFYWNMPVDQNGFCYMYKDKEELTACLMGEWVDENTLFLSRSHKLSICKEPAARAYLFTVCIRDAVDKYTDASKAVIQIQSFDKKEQEFLLKLSGNEGKVCPVREWAMRV